MKKDFLYSRSIAVTGLPEFLESLGGSPDALFKKAGLSIKQVSSRSQFVSWNGICNVLEIAAAELDEPSLGLKWAYHMPKDYLNSGPMLFLGALVPTMRDFLQLALKYQALHTNGVRYDYVEHKDEKILEGQMHIHPASAPCRQYAEHIVGVCVLMEKNAFAAARYHKIQFQHSAPDDLTWHEKIFPIMPEFNANVTSGSVQLGLINAKLGGQIKFLKPFLEFHLNRKMKKETSYKDSIVQLVVQLLPSILGVGNSSLTDMANVLEISPKKLQRLLKAEGLSYSQVIDDVRRSIAERLLYESDAPILRIAYMLDYTSSEALNSACQRWWGVSPRSYRQSLRAR